jgi:Transferrin
MKVPMLMLVCISLSQGARAKHIRWCTHKKGAEQAKCAAMVKIMNAAGLQNTYSCVEGNKMPGCLDAIAKGSADVVMTKAAEAFQQAELYGAQAVVAEGRP